MFGTCAKSESVTVAHEFGAHSEKLAWPDDSAHVEPVAATWPDCNLDAHLDPFPAFLCAQVSGPRLLQNVVMAASKGMSTESSTLVQCVEGAAGTWELEAESTTKIELNLPNWVPIPAEKARVETVREIRSPRPNSC